MNDPARMKTDEPVFGMLEAALYNAPLWKQGTVIFDGYAGQFQTDQDQVGWVNSPEITDADGNTVTGLDSKRSMWRARNSWWNAVHEFNPPALTRDQQERIANQRYESSSGTIYTQDNIMALYSVEDTKEFWDTSGGPTHLRKRIRDTLDETERVEAMFQHGTVLGFGSMILSGTLDPVGIGTFFLTKNRIPGVRQANEARRALKNIRALEKSVKAGKSLSTAQSVALTRWDKISKAFPSTAKRLGYAVGTNASEATLSLYFESFVDEQLDVDDYVSAVGAAGVFTTAIMGLGAGGARAMQQASKVYQKAVDNHLVKQIGRVEKQSAPGRSLPTPQEREDLVSMALDIAKTNEEPFKVAYERLLKMSGKIHDFAVRAKSFNQLKDRPSDLIYDDNPFVRGLSNILFRQNVLLDADDFDPKIAISDFLAHHRQVVDNQKYVTSETAREFIAPDTPNGDQEWLDAVIELLDEAPVEKVDEQGVSKMVDRLDADNSPYLEKSEAWKEAARKEAETIRNTIFVYEGEELGLAERKAFYFPHGNRVKEYLNDDTKVEQFEKNVEEYLRDEIGITDPDEIKKFTDRATSSIQSSGPGSKVSLGFTIDDSGRIGNEFLAQSEVSTPGQTKERTINLPFRVMRPFYQEDSHLVLDTAMSRNNVVMATQELLKLNPKGHLDLLPKPKPEFKAPEDGSEPVEVPDYRDDWNSDTVKLKARESWSNPDEAAESLDRILRTTKSTEEAYVNARTAKKDHNAVIKENRQQLKDKNAQIKEEFGEEVAGRTDSLNDLLDEEDLFTEELENLLEIQLEGEQGLESIGNQLRKFSDRVTRNLATESRKMKALKESKGVRAVRRDEADKLYNESESIVVKMDDTLVKKSEKQTKKLEANIETQKRGIVRSTEMLRLLRHFNGDKSEGLTTQQINEMVQFVSEEYSQPERFIRDFLKKKPESHIKKYERELARSNDKLSKAEEALKEWDDTGRKSAFTDKEQAKYDAAVGDMETYGEILSMPSEDAQKVWNSKVANALSIKVKDLRGQASLFNADNPLDISPELAEVLTKRGFKVRLGNAYFTGQDLVDEIARRQTALSENSNKILDTEDSIRSLESQVAEQAEGIRRFIQDNPGKEGNDEFIALVNQLESSLTQRETLKGLAAEAREVFKESRKVFRQATGSSYRTKSVSDKQYNSRVADIRHDHVMSTLSMGISSNGGKYELTEKGWAGEIKTWYEQKMIENPEQADALQASMDKAAYLLGRFRDNTLGLEYRHIDDGGFGEKALLNVSRVGSMARTFFTISKNTMQDASIAVASGVEGAKLSKVFLRGLEKHMPGEDLKNIDKDVMGKMHRAAELAGLNRQGASSNRAYQLGDEGAQASKEIRGDSASDKVTTGFGKVWQTGSGFKYVQPYLRDTFSILYTDMILGFGERINMGKKLHPEDIDQLRRAGLTPEDAESIYADWAITQQAEDLVDVETGLKVVADLDVFTPKNREGLQQAVFNMVERIHLKPRFEDKYIMTGKDPGEAVKTERLMLALQGFSQTSHNIWFQGGLQSAMKHKRLGAYTERVLGATALAVAINAGYRELTKTAEPEGAARPYDEDMTLGSYFLYTVNKSGVFGELSGLYDAARYSTAAKLIRDGAPEGGFETGKAIKGFAADAFGMVLPGIGGAIDVGGDALAAGYVAGVQPLVADKPTKKEVYKELGGLIKNGPFRGLLFIADLMEFGGWLKKRQQIKTRKQKIEVRKEQR